MRRTAHLPDLSSPPAAGRAGGLATVAEILALGYFRYRRKLAAGGPQKEAPAAEKPLDDVTPRGRVGTGEGRTPETGGDA